VMNFLRQELPVMVPVAAGSATGKSSSGWSGACSILVSEQKRRGGKH
jgi:hypothetical protein